MTDEQNERLKQIRERSESKKRVAAQFEWARVGLQEWADIDFLLSLVDSQVAERGYWPMLIDRGDGVRDHFCIGRLIKPSEPYWEFWNKGQWVSAGEVFIGREAAQTQLDKIRSGNGIVLAGACVHCGHNNYDAERGECKQRWMEGRMSVVCGCPCAKHNSLANVAASMRSACIEKVKQVERLLRGDAELAAERRDTVNHAALLHKAEAMKALAKSLESVTIQEQEKQK